MTASCRGLSLNTAVIRAMPLRIARADVWWVITWSMSWIAIPAASRTSCSNTGVSEIAALRIRQAQPAVIGDGGEAGEADPARVGVRAFEQKGRAGITQGQARELLAHDGPDMSRGVAPTAEM